MIYLLPVLFMLLVQVQVIDWKDQLLGSDLVLQFVDDDVNPDSLAPMLAVNYTKLNSTQCVTTSPAQCLQWSCEAVGSPDEAKLEQLSKPRTHSTPN